MVKVKKIEQNRKKTEKNVRYFFMTIIVKYVDNHNMLWYSKYKRHKSELSVPLMVLKIDKLRTFVLTNENL